MLVVSLDSSLVELVIDRIGSSIDWYAWYSSRSDSETADRIAECIDCSSSVVLSRSSSAGSKASQSPMRAALLMMRALVSVR